MNINIRKLEIFRTTKKFEVKNYGENKEETAKKIIKEKDDFLKEVQGEEFIEHRSYGDIYSIEYYAGYIEFCETKTEKGSLKLELKLNTDFINNIIAMSLDNSCQIAEEQTKQFQNIFTSFVKKNQNSIRKSQNKIKSGLLKRLEPIKLK